MMPAAPGRYAAGMIEERIVELETRFAYQDETLRVLSDTVAEQQRRIDTLTALCRQLTERLRTLSSEGELKSNPADEIPPHY